MSYHKLFTLGYTNWTIDKVADTLETLDAFLLDVRFQPWSNRIEFTKPELKKRFPDRYGHLRGFGNVEYRTREIRLEDFNGALALLDRALRKKNCILMCVCPDHTKCHRFYVVQLVEEEIPVPVIHLYPSEQIPLL